MVAQDHKLRYFIEYGTPNTRTKLALSYEGSFPGSEAEEFKSQKRERTKFGKIREIIFKATKD